jgi:hypothetical protein
VPQLKQFHFTQPHNTQFWKSKKVTFLNRAKFFLPGMKVLWDEGGGRVLLSDNASISDSALLQFGFKIGFPINTHVVGRVYSQHQLAQNLTRFERSRTRLLLKSGSVCACNLKPYSTLCCDDLNLFQLKLLWHEYQLPYFKVTKNSWFLFDLDIQTGKM